MSLYRVTAFTLTLLDEGSAGVYVAKSEVAFSDVIFGVEKVV